MKYHDFWKERGLDFIVPPGGDNPEGFDVNAVLKDIVGDSDVLEIGCGTGRIAKHFNPYSYVGVDINPAALAVAGAALPLHAFSHWDGKSMLPKAPVAILYTVCLHVPDDEIDAMIARASEAARRVVIAEIMNPRFRQHVDGGYTLSNQRSLEDYIQRFMSAGGMKFLGARPLPYAHYPGEFITFATFERIPK